MNNDPWSVLIDTLNGAERRTPDGWAAKRVHRMSDSAWPNVRPKRPARRPQLDALSRLAMARATPRLRCTCAECTPVAASNAS